MHNKNIKPKIGHNKQKMEKRLSWVLFNNGSGNVWWYFVLSTGMFYFTLNGWAF